MRTTKFKVQQHERFMQATSAHLQRCCYQYQVDDCGEAYDKGALPSSSETDSKCNRFSLRCALAAVQPDSSEAAYTGSWKFSYVLLQIIAAQEGS
jgi:hypothetical protein